MDTIVVLNKDQMGHGDQGLGQKVLGTFLKKSIAMKDFTAIVLFNDGVRLVAEGSPVLAELRIWAAHLGLGCCLQRLLLLLAHPHPKRSPYTAHV